LTSQNDLVPSFLSPLKTTDKPVLTKNGTLLYDTVRKSYIIEPSEKLAEDDELIFNTQDCSLKLYGTPDFNLNLGRVIWDNFGTLYHTYNENSTLFDGVINMKFFFDEKAMKLFYDAVEGASGNGAEQNTDKFLNYLYAKLPVLEAERLEREITTYGSYRKLPSELEKTILFSDVKMQWDETSRSFVSTGKLGIAAIEQGQINKYVDGTMQIIKSRKGDVINLYVETGSRDWYFFSYNDGLMQVLSSNMDFNDIITNLKASKRKQRKGEGRGSYEFDISTIRKRAEFLRAINKIKQSQEESDPEEEDYEEEEYIDDEEDIEEYEEENIEEEEE
jgi:hypothetical protein